MGNAVTRVFDPQSRVGGGIEVPVGYTEPTFPSLYIPSFRNTQSEVGVFIYEAETIWHFTLYWILILCGGIFLLCSAIASFSLFLSLTVFREDPRAPTKGSSTSSGNPSVSGHKSGGATTNGETAAAQGNGKTTKRRSRARKRPPLWPLLLLPLFSVLLAALVSVITGTVIGFALAAVYSAGGFVMSTWVPFLWGLITVLILIISSYSTLTSIL